MKNLSRLLCLLSILSLTSCKSIVANSGNPLNDNSLKLNHRYEVQDFTAKIHKIKITSIDNKNIYGISKKGETFSIDKRQIREVKEVKVMRSIIVGIIAISAFIFIPI